MRLNLVEHVRTLAGRSSKLRRLGVSVREYRAIEAGERAPGWETRDRILERSTPTVPR